MTIPAGTGVIESPHTLHGQPAKKRTYRLRFLANLRADEVNQLLQKPLYLIHPVVVCQPDPNHAPIVQDAERPAGLDGVIVPMPKIDAAVGHMAHDFFSGEPVDAEGHRWHA